MEIHKVGFSETVAIVVIDDDPNIHELWKKRLANRVKNYHFSNSAAFEKWYLSERNSSERFLYLFDHDLTDETKTGMDLIRKFDLFTQAILVTGREKDETLLIECAQSKLRFLRKSAIPNILIEMNTRVEE
jgi:DNA-binding NtrC family response regulator